MIPRPVFLVAARIIAGCCHHRLHCSNLGSSFNASASANARAPPLGRPHPRGPGGDDTINPSSSADARAAPLGRRGALGIFSQTAAAAAAAAIPFGRRHHHDLRRRRRQHQQLKGPSQPDADDVYILELAGGRVYVGKSSDVDRRVRQHARGDGAAFTKAFPPTGNLLPRLGAVRGCGDAAERDETLRYMLLRGIGMVRGWRYVRVEMGAEEHEDAEANIRELFGLCRRCGNGGGHFMGRCVFEFDRLGRWIGGQGGQGGQGDQGDQGSQ